MKFLVGYNTDNGIRKKENQDSLVIKTASSPYGRIGLFAVCDGMGGLSSGELASSTVVKGFSKWFDNEISNINFNNIDDLEIFNIIEDKVRELNNKILQYGESKDERLGTTLTLMLTVDRKAYIFQVGDSRVYKIYEKLEQITVDQSFVQREIERGNLTKEEAVNHPKKNVLLQCVGAKKKVVLKMDVLDIKEGQVYLICSDGFYRKLSNKEILEKLKCNNFTSNNQISEKVIELTEMVKSRKELDNITAIVIKLI